MLAMPRNGGWELGWEIFIGKDVRKKVGKEVRDNIMKVR
jgi:hypothetical protein